MARIQPLEQVDFGGVDSRSNPINMPTNRLLRCLNWVPKQAGLMELRWGYSAVSMPTPTVAPVSGLIPFRQWNGNKNVLVFQGLTWSVFGLPNGSPSAGSGALPGTLLPATIRGTPLTNPPAGPGNAYVFNNSLYYGNGKDQKVFDGNPQTPTWRDNGIRAPNTAEIAAVTFTIVGTTDPTALPASSLSGYQFYMAYKSSVTNHVGNRAAIGPRAALTTSPFMNVGFSGLPTSSLDSEWQVVLGRTGDGAQVPYVCTNADASQVILATGQAAFTLSTGQGGIDGNFELPTRNGIIPSVQTMFAVVGDYVYSCDPNSPTVRLSGSALDANAGRFMGRPEQSWAANDVETFPTAEAVTGLFEVNLEAFVGTMTDCAILSDLAGVRAWRGPWPVGIAGPRAGTKTHHGFFWLSGDKQLCTFQDGLPVPVSEEYEAAELAQLSDALLSSVELRYFRSPALNKDELRIEGTRASDGTPYTIIHDFKLTDQRSPQGQGYGSQFVGASPLGTVFTSAVVRDGLSKMQIFAAGSSTASSNQGQLYQLYTGPDDAGNQFTADAIALINTGQDRPSVPWIDWYGDQNVDLQIGRVLATTLATPTPQQQNFEDLTPSDNQEVPPGYEYDFRFRAKLAASELHHTYFRFLLTSHPADGSLSYNSPVHLPLENYGRIYALIPSLADTREQ
jgi:hypothetical protein